MPWHHAVLAAGRASRPASTQVPRAIMKVVCRTGGGENALHPTPGGLGETPSRRGLSTSPQVVFRAPPRALKGHPRQDEVHHLFIPGPRLPTAAASLRGEGRSKWEPGARFRGQATAWALRERKEQARNRSCSGFIQICETQCARMGKYFGH